MGTNVVFCCKPEVDSLPGNGKFRVHPGPSTVNYGDNVRAPHKRGSRMGISD